MYGTLAKSGYVSQDLRAINCRSKFDFVVVFVFVLFCFVFVS